MNRNMIDTAGGLFSGENTGRLLTAILIDRQERPAPKEILDRHAEYRKLQEHLAETVEASADTEAAGRIKAYCEGMAEYQEEAAYLQGLKDGLSLLLFAAGSTATLFDGTETFDFSTGTGKQAENTMTYDSMVEQIYFVLQDKGYCPEGEQTGKLNACAERLLQDSPEYMDFLDQMAAGLEEQSYNGFMAGFRTASVLCSAGGQIMPA